MDTETTVLPGEQHALPRPLARRAADGVRAGLTGHAATALRSGSVLLLAKGWGLIAPHSPLWERIGYVAGGGYVIGHTVAVADAGSAAPFLAPGTVILWCTAAWMVAPPPDRTSSQADTAQADSSNPEDDEDLLDAEIVTALIRKVAGGTQGAHLEDLLATGKFGSRSKANLKALLIEEYHLPVESFGTRVDGRKRTRDGVRLRHLPPAAADPTPSTPE
ncbi:hypothetical protein ACIRD6_13375 [Streptomyces sp. NPDC102473]|uniref:hypothetical protein n=1 Tax=Streptomyces sp. NPDC102473 TaxID=3366180 RepID=UPI00380DA2A3